MYKRNLSSLARAAAFVGAGLFVSTSAHALNFAVTWGNDGTAANFTAAQQAAIQGGLNTIAATYFDKVTVQLHIMNSASGLGGSAQALYADTYAGYRSALIADSKSALDAQAVSTLGAANPFGTHQVAFTAALGRALGYNTGPATNIASLDGSTFYDCDIFLNGGLCFTGAPAPGKYDLAAVAMHEADESMGFGGPGSLIGTGNIANYVGPQDLFRYKSNGVRTNLVNANGEYFSVDGGATNIRTWNNHANGGDAADWASDGNAYVQNAFGTPNVAIAYSAKEIAAGDSIGWDTVQTTPEPATMVALGLGVAGFLRRRKKA